MLQRTGATNVVANPLTIVNSLISKLFFDGVSMLRRSYEKRDCLRLVPAPRNNPAIRIQNAGAKLVSIGRPSGQEMETKMKSNIQRYIGGVSLIGQTALFALLGLATVMIVRPF